MMRTNAAKIIPIRVLLAEDESLVGDVIAHELEKGGYEVAGRACNGSAAIELTKSLKPDIVLMDIEMPVMNGFEAMRRIFDQCPVPVILLTAHDTPSFIVDAGMIGAAGYLVKPSNIREIDRAITIGLARFNDIMELRRVNVRLNDALAKVNLFSRPLSVCSECRMVRNDQGSWEGIESWLETLTGIRLMEGLCPSCREKAGQPPAADSVPSAPAAEAGDAGLAIPPSVPAEGSEVLQSGNTLKVFKYSEIVYIEAQDDYTIVHVNDGKKHVVRRLLKDWESHLPESIFLRIHRSYLINLNFVSKIEKWFNHAFRIFMTGAKEPIAMSRRYSHRLRGKLKDHRMP